LNMGKELRAAPLPPREEKAPKMAKLA